MFFYRSRQAFTLIELLVVIAIVSVLSIVVILVINPVELLRQARDSNRLSNVNTVERVIALYQVDNPGASIGSLSTTYLSLVDTTATTTAGTNCAGIGMAAPANWAYHCAASSTQTAADGTGWIPINLNAVSFGSPIGSLPVDPTNTSSSGLYFMYTPSATSFALATMMESGKYLTKSFLDGGYDPGRYEVGSNLVLMAQAEGLVGWWPFNEGSGTTANDQSGNGNNGSIIGGVTLGQAGKVGNAMLFNGSNGYITMAAGVLTGIGSGSFTVEAWVKTTTSLLGRIATSRTAGDTAWWSFFMATDGKIHLETSGGEAGSNAAVNDGNWHQVVAVKAGTAVTYYVDGVASGGAMFSIATSLTTSAHTTIGVWDQFGDGSTPIQYFGGTLDEVAVYKRPLTAAEIQAIYNATR